MKLETTVPEEYQGPATGQINQRRGVITGTTTIEGNVTIEAEVPLTEMFGYSTDLRSGTKGKGEFSMEFMKFSFRQNHDLDHIDHRLAHRSNPDPNLNWQSKEMIYGRRYRRLY